MPRFRRAASRHKADGSLVTETDLAVQRQVVAALASRFPGVPVLGEEMSVAEQREVLAQAAGSGFWCLDPLDGTSNYACGFPYFAVSLALIVGEEVVRGVIVDPVRNECFCAERGLGAFLDGEPVRVQNEETELGECLAIVDLKRLAPVDLPRLGGEAAYRSQRNLGAVALDWCWIAAGRAQLYLHGGQKLWDYAAGRLIAQESGAPTRILAKDGGMAAPELSLAPRMAVAAANAVLFERWHTWLGLPPPTRL